MKVEVQKDSITKTIKSNRDAHKAIFKEALEGYRKKALELLAERIREIEEGKLFTYISMVQPEDHTRDYDRVLAMLEAHAYGEITLTEADYAMYVLDDWQWKRAFLTSNSQYSGTAAAALAQAGDE